MSAPDVTADFIRKLINNSLEAERVALAERIGGFVSPGGGAVATGARWLWFYQRVRGGGPWDFKNNDYAPYRSTGLVICGRQYRFDMPGNFHYGFVGAAAGFTSAVLFRMAGEAQQRAGTSRPEYHCTYGDDPEDQEFIRLGILLYNTVDRDVTVGNLGQNLLRFSPTVCATR